MHGFGRIGTVLVVLTVLGGPALAGDWPEWGARHARNMISSERGLPTACDPATGAGVKWTAPLGDNAYGSPVVAEGCVFVGANNRTPRDPRVQGDFAVLLCLNEADGQLRWQLPVPRMTEDRYFDWPEIAWCSPCVVEDGRVYSVTNRYEVVCLDIDGQADGNDGLYRDEGQHMVPPGEPALEPGPQDGDILWRYDMVNEAGIWPHDAAFSAILIDGPYLYVNSCNGVDNTHEVIRKPDAPSLIVLDKATGRLVAQDGEGIGPMIFHSTWSSPALGVVNGQRLVFFAGGDGVCYAFKALEPGIEPGDKPRVLERVWRFDCDPAAPKENVSSYLRNRREGPTNVESMPVFHRGRLYVTAGGDIWWGKNEAWLLCVDAAQTGDITESGRLWSYPLDRHACATPAIVDGLVFVADCRGQLHCVDAETGEGYWKHRLAGEIWASPLAADGKVYVGSRRGDLCVVAAKKELEVLNSIEFGDAITSTVAPANGVLYVNTLKNLYAITGQTGE